MTRLVHSFLCYFNLIRFHLLLRALNNIAEKSGEGPFGKGSGLFYWSPTMNLGRDPRWGRFQESVSEDPVRNLSREEGK